jgi:hypothetical protein
MHQFVKWTSPFLMLSTAEAIQTVKDFMAGMGTVEEEPKGPLVSDE